MPASFLPADTTATQDWLARRASLVQAARDLQPALRERAKAADETRTLPEATIQDLHRTGLFRVLQPARWGGAEVDFGIYVEIGAILAGGCASTAWVWANLVSHHWMLAYWPEPAQSELWTQDRDMLIGSALVFPCGKATRADGGYRISGRWPFSSGIDHSSWIMLGGLVPRDGKSPEQRLFLVPPDAYEVIDTWHTSGLRGTGSRDVTVKDWFVPEHLTLDPISTRDRSAPGCKVNPAPAFQIPMMAVFPYAIVGIVLGIAEDAVQRYTDGMRSRAATYTGMRLAEVAPLQLKVAEAGARCAAARALLAHDCAEITRIAERGLETDMEQRVRYRRNGAYAAQLCVGAVDLLFTGSGGGGIYDSNPIQRAWRDVHAASAHITLTWDSAASLYGRVAFGLSADAPAI
jgi:3-hydroxy-9,10-secoandrosta-1,3,5(10)-triene-9,17-dione monooxygenase